MYRYFAVRFLVLLGVTVMISSVWLCSDYAIADPQSNDTQDRHYEPFLHDPETWERLARDGDTEAQFVLGLLHSDGAGVPLDYEKAFFWYHEAAKQNHIDAQYNLAHLYLSGDGVDKDLAQAIHWWRKAAEKGHVRAQYNLGFAYFRGIGIDQDHEQALIWIRKAAGRNDARAQKLLKVLESEVASLPSKPAPIADSVRGETDTGSSTAVEEIAIEAKRTPPMPSADARGTPPELDSTDNNSWLFNQPADFFTAQLISSTKRSDVADYLAKQQLRGQGKVFKTTRDGEDWWYLLFGSYPTREAATAAVESMNIKVKSVWIRHFGSLHKKRCQTLASIEPSIVDQFCP